MLEENQILWDVVEEHLDEADFLMGTWASARQSPSYTLEELQAGPQARLLAHVDGLIVNGPLALKRVVLPVLDQAQDDVTRTAAAVLTMVQSGDLQVLASLQNLEACDSELSEHAKGFALGLALSQHAKLDATLRSGLTEAKDTDLLVRLEACAYRGADPGPVLDTSLRSEHPLVLAVSLRAASNAPKARYLGAAESMLHHNDAGVRDAALNTALRWGSRGAWDQAVVKSTRADPLDPLSMVWCAMLGDQRHAEALAKHLDNEAMRNHALWALGFSGYRAAVAACMPYLGHDDDTTRRLAGEAVAATLGLDPEDDTLWVSAITDDPAVAGDDPVEDTDDLDEDLELGAVDELALPNPETIGQRWSAVASGWNETTRWLGGRALGRDSVVRAMAAAPCRRLDTLANEALSRSSTPGACWPTRAMAEVHLERIRSLVL